MDRMFVTVQFLDTNARASLRDVAWSLELLSGFSFLFWQCGCRSRGAEFRKNEFQDLLSACDPFDAWPCDRSPTKVEPAGLACQEFEGEDRGQSGFVPAGG